MDPEQQHIEVYTGMDQDHLRAKSMLQISQDRMDEFKAVIESGRWSDTLKSMAMLGTLQATEYLITNMDHLSPAQVRPVLDTLHGIAKTELGEPSHLSSSLTVSLDGKDLTRDQLLHLITKAKSRKSQDLPPKPKHSPKSKIPKDQK